MLSPGESRLIQRYEAGHFSKFAPEHHFLELFTEAKGKKSESLYLHRNSFFFAPFRDMTLPDAKIQVAFIKENEISLTTDTTAFFVVLDIENLPGTFSDNNFTLLPGEIRKIRFQPKQDRFSADLMHKLSICHLRQTYEKA